MLLKSRKSPPKPTIPLENCLAKTHRNRDGTLGKGRTVEEHCRITGAVAEELLRRLLSFWQKGGRVFPEHSHLPPLLHDIGKVCPTFQKKIYTNLPDIENFPQLNGKDIDVKLEREWGYHAGISYAEVDAHAQSERLALCVGLHHATYFTPQHKNTCEQFGGEAWAQMRHELLEKLRAGAEWPKLDTATQTLLLAGLTIVSDWIASGDLFSDPARPWEERVKRAVDEAGFLYPQAAPGLTFEEIFGFCPNACQKTMAETVSGPGVYILEAPMGSGKTEGALFAAYQLLAKGIASGIYFALPTQLTSNMMHVRVAKFLEKIMPDGVAPTLVHGDAWLARKMLQKMGGEEASPGGAWFEQGRRSILAPFAVGTVDQALMAAIHVSYAGLRMFGLAGKVVILDEIHSYDAYTSRILDKLVEHLSKLGCTVIILSATLAQARRKALLDSIGATIPGMSDAYPLLTAAPAEEMSVEVPIPGFADVEVAVHLTDDEERALDEILARAEAGQQAVWIENSVGKAQEIYRILACRAAQFGIETGLLHSRFMAGDRLENEKVWTGILGKPGSVASSQRSSKGRILVGTQVIEQSLDIDADFMVSRFAPSDLILQRLGRLWRHEREDRPQEAVREAWLLAPNLEKALSAPKEAFRDTATSLVYPPYVLTRSLEVWAGLKDVHLPRDIRKIIEETYRPRSQEINSAMAKVRKLEEEEVQAKINQALQGCITLGKPMSDETATARLTDIASVKVLLLHDVNLQGGRCKVEADGEWKDLRKWKDSNEKIDLAIDLALHTVAVPEYWAPPPAPAHVQDWFAPFIHEAKYGTLRILLIDRAGNAHDINGCAIEGIEYKSRTGYNWKK